MRLVKIITRFWVFYLIQSFSLDVQANCDKARTISPTTQLQKSLLCGYDRHSKPVKTYTNTTNVKFDMRVMFLNFFEQQNSLEIHTWSRVGWKDEFLTWKEADHEGITRLVILPSLIWTPDMTLHTPSYIGDTYLRFINRRCWLASTGNILCAIPVVYSAHCYPDIKLWPFDTHNCTMRIGSWTSYDSEMNITLIGPGISFKDEYGFNQFGDWTLLNATAVEAKYPTPSNDTRSVPYVLYSFVLQRNSGVFAATVIVPSFVLAVMTAMVFWLDIKSPERMGVMCLNILCHCLYMQYLSVNLPSNGETVPIILVIFRDSLVMVIVSFAITLLVRRLQEMRSSPPVYVTGLVRAVVHIPLGQFFFLGNFDPKMIAGINESKESDESDLVEATPKLNAWTPFAMILDRIAYISFLIVYVILLTNFIPNSQ